MKKNKKTSKKITVKMYESHISWFERQLLEMDVCAVRACVCAGISVNFSLQ